MKHLNKTRQRLTSFTPALLIRQIRLVLVLICGSHALWLVLDTGPWLHDGRATSLSEAILMHGGEGTNSRNAFAALDKAEQANMIAFLNSLVVYKFDAEEVAQK